MKLSCLILCVARAEDISNLATQKSCQQTIMDDEMKYCADRNYSLRTSFDIFISPRSTYLQYKNYKSTCVTRIFEQLESRCGNWSYSCIIVNSDGISTWYFEVALWLVGALKYLLALVWNPSQANYPTWRMWQASNYR